MSKCILCDNETQGEFHFCISQVDSYRERQKKEEVKDSAGTLVIRETLEKQVLLQEPGETISGTLCPRCLRKTRKKNLWGVGLSLGGVLFILIANLLLNGLPLIFLRIGLFLSLVLLMIFSMPLFRPKRREIIDQFFLKVRSEKEEPVISLQDVSYYYGRKVKHWMMIRQEHWDELEIEDGLRILEV